MVRNIVLILMVLVPFQIFSQIDSVLSIQKINNQIGGLIDTTIESASRFGAAVEVIGDVDHDGVDDIAIGAYLDDDNDPNLNKGAVFILLLNNDGTVKSQKRISGNDGGPDDFSASHRYFGCSIAALGDLNGDGNVDIAVGMYGGGDKNVAGGHGAVYILFLDDDGSMLEYQKISNNYGGGPEILEASDYFGGSIANIGDINGDGLPDIAIKASGDDDGFNKAGAIYIGFLDYNGTLKGTQKISLTTGGFTDDVDTTENIGGGGVTGIGDLNHDGVPDIAIGSTINDDGGTDRGAFWVCFMNSNGTISSMQKISDTEGGFTGVLDDEDNFGIVLGVNDLDLDGVPDIAIGATGDDDGVTNGGAIWFLYMNSDGTVKNYDKIACNDSLLIDEVESGDYFTSGLSYFGDRNNDGIIDLLIGAYYGYVSGYGGHTGEVYVAHMAGTPSYPHKEYYSAKPLIKEAILYNIYESPLDTIIETNDAYGTALSSLGDFDGDGIEDIIVGASGDDDGGTNRGAVYIEFLNADGTIKNIQKISSTEGNLSDTLTNGDRFGCSVTNIGDLNKDGIIDVAVGAYLDDDNGTDRGAVWILFLDTNGTVKSDQKISDTEGGFTGVLGNQDYFGKSLASADINKDGNNDIIVGASGDDDGGGNRGAIWVLFLDTNGTVSSHQKISSTTGNLNSFYTLTNGDGFGWGLSTLGDLNRDGNQDIVVGAIYDDDSGNQSGAVYVLMLTDSGTVSSAVKITEDTGGFSGVISSSDFLGYEVLGGYDINQDGIKDLLICAQGYDDVGISVSGIIFICYLNEDGTVKDHAMISATSANFIGRIKTGSASTGRAMQIVNYDKENQTLNLFAYVKEKTNYDEGIENFSLDLSVLKSYENDIIINTSGLEEIIPYELTIQGQNYELTTGGIENITIIDSSITQTAVLTVEDSTLYNSLTLLFDIDSVHISNVRIIADSLLGGDTLALDSGLYQIKHDGHELVLFQKDTRELQTDSITYGFVLEGGLGFSPNSNGTYETLEIAGLENIYQFNLTITDLSNSTVFYTTDKTDFWNGKYMGTGSLQTQGTYKYSMQINGQTFEGQIILDY